MIGVHGQCVSIYGTRNDQYCYCDQSTPQRSEVDGRFQLGNNLDEVIIKVITALMVCVGE